MDHQAEIVRVTSSFDAFARRDDTRDLGSLVRRTPGKRGTVALARRLTSAGIAVAALIVATIAFGLIVGPIGINGLFLVVALMLGALLLVSFWPGERARPVTPFQEDMANAAVVQRLGTILTQHRAALPAPAARPVDAIGAQLPLLESRLATLDPLDPLAQDARRLMGQHLPELIDRYERVPARYRAERDGDGMSVDQRLVAGLDAASGAIDDLSRRLAKQDVDAFETQGRFIESRYQDGGPVPGT